jgi:hypothetical protein
VLPQPQRTHSASLRGDSTPSIAIPGDRTGFPAALAQGSLTNTGPGECPLTWERSAAVQALALLEVGVRFEVAARVGREDELTGRCLDEHSGGLRPGDEVDQAAPREQTAVCAAPLMGAGDAR